MEPFGLFQFLQSLLNSPTPSASETPRAENQKMGESAPQNATSKDTQAAKNNEAILQFMQEHDRRSRRTRR